MRAERQKLRFIKMQASGNDYILVDCLKTAVSCPESLCVRLCEQHFGAGAEGMALIVPSSRADARMIL